MRFFIQTLGCKINQYESQAIREAWLLRGWAEVDTTAAADVVLVHTCAVTSGAVADSRGAVRRAGREAAGAEILVAGCAAQVEPHTFLALPGVRAVTPQSCKQSLRVWPDGQEEVSCARSWPDFSITSFKRARAILKIQDGCSHGCTYCIVPRARGGARSRPFGQIAREAQALFEAGHREVVLSGINLGQFALDDGDFWDMLLRLEDALAPEWAGRARLRLSSLDPGMLGSRALEALSRTVMTCPHLHISMQSADSGVLRAMGRAHYTADDVLTFLDGLRRHWPVLAVGADILTGFPGEPEQAFLNSLAFPERAGLTYAHVFPYSRRPGTVAAKAPNQLPHQVKKERAARLRAETSRLEGLFVQRLATLERLTMAVEGASPGRGGCEYYTECVLDGPAPAPVGALTPVRPVRAEGGVLRCVPAGDHAP